MDDNNPVLLKMSLILSGWEIEHDRRLIFLSCYKMMTYNVLRAIDAGEFEDGDWVATLMENFAGYYFTALAAHAAQPGNCPQVWQIAFRAVQNPKVNSLQNLVLGVNAHINYDLVLALSDLLDKEWASLTPDGRQMRYRDHCRVNQVIHQTINAVQDQVIDRFDPEFRLVDTLLGPLDEWMTTLLISDWREEVWRHATCLADQADPAGRQAILRGVEHVSLDRAKDILGRGNLSALFEFI